MASAGGDISFDEFLGDDDDAAAQPTAEEELLAKHKPVFTTSAASSTSPASVSITSALALFPAAAADSDELVLVLAKTALLVGARLDGQHLLRYPVLASLPLDSAFVEDIPDSCSIRVPSFIDFTFRSMDDKRDCLLLLAHLANRPFHEVVRGTLFSQIALQVQEEDGAALAARWQANVNDVDHTGKTALHYAVGLPLNPLLGTLLHDLKADPNSLDNDLCTPLHLACQCGNAVAVVVLLRFGAEVDAKDLQERTPFFTCAINACRSRTDSEFEQYKRTMESLVEAGAQTDGLRDTHDRNALHYVLAEEQDQDFQLATARALLHSPCYMDVNATTNLQGVGRTALHVLAAQNEFTATKALFALLIDAGAKVNLGDARAGDTALMLVLRGQEAHFPMLTVDRRAVASLLVSHGGARLDQLPANVQGSTPADVAKVQRLAFDKELAQWRSRQEPTAIVHALLADAQLALNVPRSCLQEEPSQHCASCRTKFSMLMQWKTVCRRCGQYQCAACAGKQVTLLHSAGGGAAAAATKEAVCDACFSSYCASVTRLGTALLEVRKSREASSAGKRAAATAASSSVSSTAASSPAQDMQALWRAKEQLLGGGEQQQQQQERPSAMAQTTSSLLKARERMGERGEKIQAVSDKTAKMKDDAENFASMAAKLRKQQENSLWPF